MLWQAGFETIWVTSRSSRRLPVWKYVADVFHVFHLLERNHSHFDTFRKRCSSDYLSSAKLSSRKQPVIGHWDHLYLGFDSSIMYYIVGCCLFVLLYGVPGSFGIVKKCTIRRSRNGDLIRPPISLCDNSLCSQYNAEVVSGRKRCTCTCPKTNNSTFRGDLGACLSNAKIRKGESAAI